MDSTQLGSSASYSCLAGYELVGVASRTCATDGMWSSEEPTCEGKHLKLLIEALLGYKFL